MIEQLTPTTYSISLPSGDRVEVGKKDRFEPTAYLSRWDGECSLRIGWPTAEHISPHILADKLVWDGAGVSCEFYQDGDAFEFEVVFKSKPTSRRLRFDLDTQGLEFFYQPELTAAEIADGAERPDNVVGSYAVYHATRGNVHASAADAAKYRAGKAFHIYRPEAVDANGERVWCDLLVSGKNLSITIPQEWLDKAAYPVVVDPTFGYTVAGGSGYSLKDVIRGWEGTPTSNGTADSITAYLSAWGSGDAIKCALYKSSDSSLLSPQTGERSDGGANDWHSFDFSSGPSVIDGTAYKIVAWANNTVSLRYDSTGASIGVYKGKTYGVWPEPLGHNSVSFRFSIYCTYTAGGGGADLTKALSDSVGLDDAIVKAPTLMRTGNLAISDAISKQPGLVASESVAVVDSLVKAAGLVKTEALPIADSLTRTVAYVRAFSDTVAIRDTISKRLATIKADAMVITDSISTGFGAIYRMAFSEIVAISDVMSGVVHSVSRLHPLASRMRPQRLRPSRVPLWRNITRRFS